MDEVERTQRSRALSMWLRHKPMVAGLSLDGSGWATVDDVLAALERRGLPTDRAAFDEILRLDAKGRFEVEGARVRARYGHSLALEEAPHPGKPPATLYHGTMRRHVPRILQMGLRPMKRCYVHLSPDRKSARLVGQRRDQEAVVLVVAAHAAHDAGVRFYPRGKAVWLSDPVPPEFLSVLPEPPRDPAAPRSSRTAREEAPGTPRRRRPRGGFMKRDRPER